MTCHVSYWNVSNYVLHTMFENDKVKDAHEMWHFLKWKLLVSEVLREQKLRDQQFNLKVKIFLLCKHVWFYGFVS